MCILIPAPWVVEKCLSSWIRGEQDTVEFRKIIFKIWAKSKPNSKILLTCLPGDQFGINHWKYSKSPYTRAGNSLISLKSNERLWAIRSDRSRQMSDCERITHSLIFLQKTRDSLRKPMSEFPALPYTNFSWRFFPVLPDFYLISLILSTVMPFPDSFLNISCAQLFFFVTLWL